MSEQAKVFDFDDFLSEAAAMGREERKREDEKASARGAYKGYSYSELKKLPPPKAILQTNTCLIPYGFVEVFGKPGTGKSMLIIELTTCGAGDAKFHGSDLEGMAGRHLYLAAEGGAGIGQRIGNVLAARKIDEAAIEGKLIVVMKPVDLNSDDNIDTVLRDNPGPWASITVDTLAQSMTGNENDTQNMNAVVRQCKRIRDTTKVSVLFLLHHEGRHAEHGRGSIALDAATDCQLRVYIDGDGGTCVRVARLRDYGLPENPVTRFRLNRVTGLLDLDTSGGANLAKREAKMRAVLVAECAIEGSIPLTQWRALCEAAGMLNGETKDAKDHQWKRALASMKQAKCIKIKGRTSAARVEPCDPPPPKEFLDDEEAFGE